MEVNSTNIPDVLIIEPAKFKDSRGFFLESFQTNRYKKYGIHLDFVQDNFAFSTKNVLRGLHYQLKNSQGKLVWVTRGKILDVALDIRVGSPTFGEWVSVILDGEHFKQLYIPPGFAHGYCVLSESADFHYKCTDYYNPEFERGVNWADPELKITWQIDNPILSKKDFDLPFLSQIPKEMLPKYE